MHLNEEPNKNNEVVWLLQWIPSPKKRIALSQFQKLKKNPEVTRKSGDYSARFFYNDPLFH